MLENSQQDELRDKLQTLHEILETVDEVADDTKEEMRVVASHLDRVLDDEVAEADRSRIGKRWRETILSFETQHPRLALAIEEITNILANAGI